MPPVDKAKAAGISASSFIDMQAVLAKQAEEFDRNKASGKTIAVFGGMKRSEKKVPKWMDTSNAGVSGRNAKDSELEEISKPTVDSRLAKLASKVNVYNELAKGKDVGLSDKQVDGLLVDFHLKAGYNVDSDDDDGPLAAPAPPHGQEDDSVIEYVDEFGRTRTGRRSQVPPDRLPQLEQEQLEYDPHVIHNPTNHFPVFEPSAERVQEINAQYAEENNPLNVHYDSTREIRAKGAGFYELSKDEETRRQQMENLVHGHEETRRNRQEFGAKDVKPGEIEGMRAEEGPGEGQAKSRSMLKRSMDLEARRELIKRKKLVEKGDVTNKKLPSSGDVQPTVPIPPSAVVDPFAALEAQHKEESLQKDNAADAFLATLELSGM